MSARRFVGEGRGAPRGGHPSLLALGLGLAVVAMSVVLIGALTGMAGLGWGLLLAGLAAVAVAVERRSAR
jgi:hypothetical protein